MNLVMQVTIALTRILFKPDLQWFNTIALVQILLIFSEASESRFAVI